MEMIKKYGLMNQLMDSGFQLIMNGITRQKRDKIIPTLAATMLMKLLGTKATAMVTASLLPKKSQMLSDFMI